MAKAQTKASAKYNAKAYQEIKLRVKTGQKDIIQAYAESKGMSLNGFINHLIEKEMHLEQLSGVVRTEELREESTIDNLTLEELDLSVKNYNALKRAGINTVKDYFETTLTKEKISIKACKEIDEIINELKKTE